MTKSSVSFLNVEDEIETYNKDSVPPQTIFPLQVDLDQLQYLDYLQQHLSVPINLQMRIGKTRSKNPLSSLNIRSN